MKKLKELLKAIGFTDETIDTVTKADADFDVDETTETVMTGIQTHLKNDKEFMGGIRQDVLAEAFSSKERKLVKLAAGLLKQEDIDALPKEGRFDKVVELLAKRAGEKKGAPGTGDSDKDKEIQTLREQLQAAEDRAKHLETEELPKVRGEVDAVKNTFTLKRELSRRLAGKKLVLDSDRTERLLWDEILEQYDLVLDKGKPVVKQKGTDLLAYADKDKSKPLTLDAVVDSIGTSANLFAKSQGKPDPEPVAGGQRGGAAGTGKFAARLPGMKAAAERAAALKGGEAEE